MYEVVDKPWGRYVVLYSDKTMWLKRLIINPGQSLSLQSHRDRDEYWLTQDKGVRMQTGKKFPDGSMIDYPIIPGRVEVIPRGWKHRLINTCAEPVTVIEWATGAPDERDIERFLDDYGRT